MQTRTVDQVESWESRPFSGGFGELHDLGDTDFTGAVVAGNAWLFMLNGRVVGVFDGSIDDFEDTDGTVYTAPHESLPLLFSMQERGGETRAKYFTNDTPLEEADKTLRDANFTGYLELSENVLSGDYYVAYYGGQKRSAAFIGQSERLETGEEAFELAADEVGVYEVKDVSMNITEVPAPAEPEPGPESETASSGQTPIGIDDPEAADQDPAGADQEPASEPATSDTDQPIDEAEDAGETESPARAESSEQSGEPDRSTAEGASSGSGGRSSEADTTDQDSGRDEIGPSGGVEESEETTTASAEESTPGSTADSSSTRSEDVATTSPEEEPEATEEDDLQAMFREEEEWRQTRSIPALDPDETEGEREEQPERQKRRPKRQPTGGTRQSRPSQSEAPTAGSDVSEETIEELKTAIEERERQIDDLAASMESVKDERNEMAEELNSLRAERDDLEERVSNLESALQRAKDEQAAIDTSAENLTPEEALGGTNLFVRYESKGKATLDVLEGGGEVDPEAVNTNLQLEHHTQFDAADVVVEGEEFEAFLHQTSSYRFIDWLVRTFPYELLESGKRSALADVYEAIPQIDRIEFQGVVDVAGEGPSSREFAVVVRDRMGNPLIVADLNDERDPVRGEQMAELVDSAVAVGDTEESLSGAFYVTASFFEPAALEEAEEAESSGGLFSRSDKASYVKTPNKSGFHLCLVEDRAESFHVTVPEL